MWVVFGTKLVEVLILRRINVSLQFSKITSNHYVIDANGTDDHSNSSTIGSLAWGLDQIKNSGYNRGFIQLTGGDFHLSNRVYVDSDNVTLRGDGRGTSLLSQNECIFTDRSQISLQDFRMHVDSTASDMMMIEVNGVNNFSLKNMDLGADSTSNVYGLYGQDINTMSISDCRFEDVPNSVFIDSTAVCSAKNVSLRNNKFLYDEDCWYNNDAVGPWNAVPFSTAVTLWDTTSIVIASNLFILKTDKNDDLLDCLRTRSSVSAGYPGYEQLTPKGVLFVDNNIIFTAFDQDVSSILNIADSVYNLISSNSIYCGGMGAAKGRGAWISEYFTTFIGNRVSTGRQAYFFQGSPHSNYVADINNAGDPSFFISASQNNGITKFSKSYGENFLP